jgi:hypothetical protein
MKISEAIEEYLTARERLTAERRKTPPSSRSVQDATDDVVRCITQLDDTLNEIVVEKLAKIITG